MEADSSEEEMDFLVEDLDAGAHHSVPALDMTGDDTEVMYLGGGHSSDDDDEAAGTDVDEDGGSAAAGAHGGPHRGLYVVTEDSSPPTSAREGGSGQGSHAASASGSPRGGDGSSGLPPSTLLAALSDVPPAAAAGLLAPGELPLFMRLGGCLEVRERDPHIVYAFCVAVPAAAGAGSEGSSSGAGAAPKPCDGYRRWVIFRRYKDVRAVYEGLKKLGLTRVAGVLPAAGGGASTSVVAGSSSAGPASSPLPSPTAASAREGTDASSNIAFPGKRWLPLGVPDSDFLSKRMAGLATWLAYALAPPGAGGLSSAPTSRSGLSASSHDSSSSSSSSSSASPACLAASAATLAARSAAGATPATCAAFLTELHAFLTADANVLPPGAEPGRLSGVLESLLAAKGSPSPPAPLLQVEAEGGASSAASNTAVVIGMEGFNVPKLALEGVGGGSSRALVSPGGKEGSSSSSSSLSAAAVAGGAAKRGGTPGGGFTGRLAPAYSPNSAAAPTIGSGTSARSGAVLLPPLQGGGVVPAGKQGLSVFPAYASAPALVVGSGSGGGAYTLPPAGSSLRPALAPLPSGGEDSYVGLAEGGGGAYQSGSGPSSGAGSQTVTPVSGRSTGGDDETGASSTSGPPSSAASRSATPPAASPSSSTASSVKGGGGNNSGSSTTTSPRSGGGGFAGGIARLFGRQQSSPALVTPPANSASNSNSAAALPTVGSVRQLSSLARGGQAVLGGPAPAPAAAAPLPVPPTPGAAAPRSGASTSPQQLAPVKVPSSKTSGGVVKGSGTPEPSSPSKPRPRHRIGLESFDLLKVIGKGSFGKVLLVRLRELLPAAGSTASSSSSPSKSNASAVLYPGAGRIYAMKVLSKAAVMKRKQVEHTITERRVLGYTRHPFIVQLHWAFQTRDKLFFVLDYAAGGELFFHLGRLGRFKEDMARFYAAEIVLALGHLHSLNVVYRDLKPENVLIDAEGHIKLADFGLSKEGIADAVNATASFCGTPEYLAPEVISRRGHGTAVDWWSLGMLLAEMLTGLPPWYTQDRKKLYERLQNAPLELPPYVSPEARSLLAGLLTRDPASRLGSARDAEDVKAHPFFAGKINWDALFKRQLPPPFVPALEPDPAAAAAAMAGAGAGGAAGGAAGAGASSGASASASGPGGAAATVDTKYFDTEFTSLPPTVALDDDLSSSPPAGGVGQGGGESAARHAMHPGGSPVIGPGRDSISSVSGGMFAGFTYESPSFLAQAAARGSVRGPAVSFSSLGTPAFGGRSTSGNSTGSWVPGGGAVDSPGGGTPTPTAGASPEKLELGGQQPGQSQPASSAPHHLGLPSATATANNSLRSLVGEAAVGSEDALLAAAAAAVGNGGSGGGGRASGSPLEDEDGVGGGGGHASGQAAHLFHLEGASPSPSPPLPAHTMGLQTIGGRSSGGPTPPPILAGLAGSQPGGGASSSSRGALPVSSGVAAGVAGTLSPRALHAPGYGGERGGAASSSSAQPTPRSSVTAAGGIGAALKSSGLGSGGAGGAGSSHLPPHHPHAAATGASGGPTSRHSSTTATGHHGEDVEAIYRRHGQRSGPMQHLPFVTHHGSTGAARTTLRGTGTAVSTTAATSGPLSPLARVPSLRGAGMSTLSSPGASSSSSSAGPAASGSGLTSLREYLMTTTPRR